MSMIGEDAGKGDGSNVNLNRRRSSADTTTLPLNELLVRSNVSASDTASVRIKTCNDSPEEDGQNDETGNYKEKRGSILSNFQRRAFSRISFRGESGPLLNRYRQTRFNSRRVRKRVVFKHGDCNVVQGNVAKRRRRYLQDIFTTLVDAQWRWTLLVFSMNFLLSWLGFALIWWLIAYSHGDLDPENYDRANFTFTPCVQEIRSFTSCFLFSVETQHTIGYGSKHTTDECLGAILVMCIQSMTGVILQAFMVGIVFAKLSRPKKRTQTLLFSRNAVVCQRDGQPCLMFRVGDMRKSHIIEAHVRAQMIKRKVTREGELLPFFQTELKVGGDGEEDKIFFIWPTTIVHKIDEQSPLYHLSAKDMLSERFEIIVMLEGVIESTGMTTQARSSYLPSEILWGHRFKHIIKFRKESSEYEVDYSLFNNTYEVDTPLCSAADLDNIKAMHRGKTERMSSGAFPYRDVSSSSLTTSSGSSLASSTGGLHMHVPSTPPNPIPVMITNPDGYSRRESVNIRPEPKQPIFYTHDESIDSEAIGCTAEDLKIQEEYNRVLEDINATLRKNRKKQQNHGEGEKKMHRNASKTTLDSKETKRNESRSNVETMRRSSSRSTIDQSQEHVSTMKKSPSRSTLDSRHPKFTDAAERHHESSVASVASSACESHKSKDNHKKTSFMVCDEEPGKSNETPVLRVPSALKVPQRLDVVDDTELNHYPKHANSYEEV